MQLQGKENRVLERCLAQEAPPKPQCQVPEWSAMPRNCQMHPSNHWLRSSKWKTGTKGNLVPKWCTTVTGCMIDRNRPYWLFLISTTIPADAYPYQSGSMQDKKDSAHGRTTRGRTAWIA